MKLYKNIDNKFFIIKNAFSKNLLDYLINLIETNIDKESTRLRFTNNYSKYYEYTIQPEDKQLLNEQYQDVLKLIYNTDPKTNFTSAENNLFKYEPGNFMTTHADGGNGDRLCTSVLYLNTMENEFEGGEVILYDGFENGGPKNEIYRYRPEAGDVVIFSSLEDEGMYHSVSPIKNWNRYAYRIYWKIEDGIEYFTT
jgi:Rps23 Pro-64 3,4-dihydroxylase Tpa1-like proline 4-hydroxylase